MPEEPSQEQVQDSTQKNKIKNKVTDKGKALAKKATADALDRAGKFFIGPLPLGGWCCIISCAWFLVCCIIALIIWLAVEIGLVEGQSVGNCGSTSSGQGELWNANAYTADQINQYLAKNWPKSPLNGKGKVIVDAAKKWGVNPSFMLGIFNAETSMGQSSGTGSHNLCGLSRENFNSWEASIEPCFKNLGRTDSKSVNYKKYKDMHEIRLKWCGYEEEKEFPGVKIPSTGEPIRYRCANGPKSDWEKEVKAIMDQMAKMFPSSSGNPTGDVGNPPPGALAVPYFNQFVPCLGKIGCAYAATTMVVNYYGAGWDQCTTKNFMGNNRPVDSMRAITHVSGKSTNYVASGNFLEIAQQEISEGNPVLTGVAIPFARSRAGHVVVIVGFTSNGNPIVHDPNNGNPGPYIERRRAPYSVADRSQFEAAIRYIITVN